MKYIVDVKMPSKKEGNDNIEIIKEYIFNVLNKNGCDVQKVYRQPRKKRNKDIVEAYIDWRYL